MEALHAASDPAGALQVARVHEALIREEHNAAPDPAITALVERIRGTTKIPASLPCFKSCQVDQGS